MRVGLRIDVDTFRGTKIGVPSLCKLLAQHSIMATFYFSVGPDNMGRHLWRLFKPAFLMKMLRSNAAGLYGWDILLRGTFWPGQVIGRNLAGIIKATVEEGHETGLHAWDHHAWQVNIDTMNAQSIHNSIERGVHMLTGITGMSPSTSAVPGWKCNDITLIEKNKFPFKYNSDCRGTDIFMPIVNGQILNQPQIPVTLPTYDEVVGQNSISDINYNDYILSLLQPDGLNVLTIHAEVEGIIKLHLFADFIRKLEIAGGEFVPLRMLLPDERIYKNAEIQNKEIKGREGWIAAQGI